ncbi:RNA 2',3'-cyclic phosphodiesterase [Rossellomorea sp. SC111]|uniref:RNA 2',3'-cyclic phosphodiesterase n=1 Tax=Rossellomorea sp. SC111 TaxID=2968985 RepID=UPI00215A738F|nr:RNA 2',3'-cyclic phosphodiesterase [Rossellomorea sp. SC111]MCR8850209.1 RNA 2',3'-cyclic phosphodiesterase [Rossellomorea sp. SC111]
MLKSHYFFALSLSEGTKEYINACMEPMRLDGSFKKWVHPEDYHLTLAFLGSADELGPVMDNVGRLAHPSFPLTLSGFGTFGKSESPRILWMGVEPSGMLHRLRDLVYGACEDAGFQLDQRPFSPHITVGRKWNGEYSFSQEWLNEFQPAERHMFTATEVVLYHTHPDRLPKYEAVHTIPLQAN